MNIFDNVTFINEGEGADVHKRKKREEEHNNRERDLNHLSTRFKFDPKRDEETIVPGRKNPYKPSKEDLEREKKVKEIGTKHFGNKINDPEYVNRLSDREYEKLGIDMHRAADGISRDARRHPERYGLPTKKDIRKKNKQQPYNCSAGIFESVEII
jgi:hypothetical protein